MLFNRTQCIIEGLSNDGKNNNFNNCMCSLLSLHSRYSKSAYAKLYFNNMKKKTNAKQKNATGRLKEINEQCVVIKKYQIM